MPRPSRIEAKYPTREALAAALALKSPAELAREIGVCQSQINHHCKDRGWTIKATTTRELVDVPKPPEPPKITCARCGQPVKYPAILTRNDRRRLGACQGECTEALITIIGRHNIVGVEMTVIPIDELHLHV